MHFTRFSRKVDRDLRTVNSMVHHLKKKNGQMTKL